MTQKIVTGVFIVAILALSISCRVGFWNECRAHNGSWWYCAHIATAR